WAYIESKDYSSIDKSAVNASIPLPTENEIDSNTITWGDEEYNVLDFCKTKCDYVFFINKISALSIISCKCDNANSPTIDYDSRTGEPISTSEYSLRNSYRYLLNKGK
ncbi:MAG: hypothetical protein AABY22_08265, partial [Nanoarchaeota archaeon]